MKLILRSIWETKLGLGIKAMELNVEINLNKFEYLKGHRMQLPQLSFGLIKEVRSYS